MDAALIVHEDVIILPLALIAAIAFSGGHLVWLAFPLFFFVVRPLLWPSRRRGYGLTDVVHWMAAGPAALAGLPGKGAIAPGRDADLVAFDDTAESTL